MPYASSHSTAFGTRVLVVDHRPSMREVVRDVLEMTGCVVQEAASADEALAILASDAVQVVVVADHGVRALVATIRAAGHPVRIVAVCESCSQTGLCGADSCLSGQFSARELARAVAG